MTEYEACIIELDVVLELKIKKLDVYMNFMLIISQMKKECKTKDEKLRLYHDYLLKLANEFKEIKSTCRAEIRISLLMHWQP